MNGFPWSISNQVLPEAYMMLLLCSICECWTVMMIRSKLKMRDGVRIEIPQLCDFAIPFPPCSSWWLTLPNVA